jgi:hypothetical protein
MIDHVWTVACLNSVVDVETNAVSLFVVLEQLKITGVPAPDAALGIQFDVVSLWERSDPERPVRGDCQIAIVSPGGVQLHAFQIGIDLETHGRARTRLHVGGFPAVEAGRYLIVAGLREGGATEFREVAHVPVHLIFEPPAEVREAEHQASQNLPVN